MTDTVKKPQEKIPAATEPYKGRPLSIGANGEALRRPRTPCPPEREDQSRKPGEFVWNPGW